MDAIIFFQNMKDIKEWKITSMYRGDFLLVKVEVNAEPQEWFGRGVPVEPVEPEEPRGWWLKRYRERKRSRQSYESQKQEYRQEQEALETRIRDLAQEIVAAVEDAGARGEISCIYEEGLGFLAGGEGEIGGRWQQFWNAPQFQAYQELRWCKPLLKELEGNIFVLLGTAPCIPQVLAHCAVRMKGLYWYLSEEDYKEETEAFAEDFYEEYGLTITICPVEGKGGFGRLRLKFRERVTVLDFTKEEKLFPGELEGGSLWIDFCSVEEKRKRLERLAPGVKYKSLVKWFRLCRRNVPQNPDRLRNTGYISRFS